MSNKTKNTPNEPAANEPAANAPAANAPANQPAPAAEPSFSKADIDKAVADALKDSQKEAETLKEREQLSKEERLELELEESRRENAMIKAEGDVIEALTTAGAKSPKLLFEAKRGALEFKDGKLTNLSEVVASLKVTYADQFGIEKPDTPIDAGAGQQASKDRAETLGGALKNFYKKQ